METTTHHAQAVSAARSRKEGASIHRQTDNSYDKLFDYWYLLRRRWLLITLLTIAAFAWVFIITKFVSTKWYQAKADIRPTTPQGEASQLSSMASAALGGGSGLGALLSMAGVDSEAQDRANEFLSIIQSYSFTLALVKRHDLAPKLNAESKGFFPSKPLTSYQMYKTMQGRLNCSYDLDSGNIGLTFLAPSRDEARRVLNYYIEDLQNKLREREVQAASLAIQSLKRQAASTADTFLQADLYQLLAMQVQRQQLAQVQADLSFTVIEPPFVPDKPYRPRVLLSSVIAAMLAFCATCGGIIFWHHFTEAHSGYHARIRENNESSMRDAPADASPETPVLLKERAR